MLNLSIIRRSPLLILVVLVSSCASLMNEGTTKTTIFTSKSSKVVFNNDTIYPKKNAVKLKLERKNRPVNVIIINDSFTKKLTIKPINSSAYYLNILSSYGIGMIIDRKNDKRYSYPKAIYVTSDDTLNHYLERDKYLISKEKRFFLHLSLPAITVYNLKPEHENRKITAGILGITTGIDYYYTRNQYLGFNVNASVSGVAPFFYLHNYGGFESLSSISFSVTNNHNLYPFLIGYGISRSSHTWKSKNYGGIFRQDASRIVAYENYNSYGFLFSGYYQISNNFNIGMIYKPSIYRPKLKEHYEYEHLISVDLAWKIRL